MRILAIETSCDDTGIALVNMNLRRSGRLRFGVTVKVEQNFIASQTKLHAEWGGVVPNLAKNGHIKSLPRLWSKIISRFTFHVSRIDFVAVTVGPGLEPALWAGIEFAKKLGAELKIPVVGANHLEGHLYSFLLQQKNVGRPTIDDRSAYESVIDHPTSDNISFPAIILLVSGGNTILVRMDDINHWQVLGKTKDDAVGEAFDKVARMLQLPYPGGPAIEALAKKGNPNAIQFPRPMLRDQNYDFSFSGLKTSVLYYLRDRNVGRPKTDDRSTSPSDVRHLSSDIADVAASFQQAAIDVLVKKTERAAQEFSAASIVVCGGVAANTALRIALQTMAEKNSTSFIAPAMEYNTDNAAMIAVAAYMRKSRRGKALPLVADATLSL